MFVLSDSDIINASALQEIIDKNQSKYKYYSMKFSPYSLILDTGVNYD